jgi:hypothetical protein
VRPTSLRFRGSLLFGFVLAVPAVAGVAYAQRAGCSEPDRPSIGVTVGRSSPYFYLDREAVSPEPPGSISVRTGWQVSSRSDLSIAGPWKVRVEASSANWNVEVRTYDPARNFELVATTSAGHVAARQIGAGIGLRGGRWPTCWNLLAGGGLYSLTFRDQTIRQPGFAITAGIEVPTGERGKVQVDVQLHLIDTDSRPPVSSTTALATSLVAGWAYRF